MIAFFSLDLNKIAISPSDYCWPRPSRCPRCLCPKLWGHGFVGMIIVGFDHALTIRRYRCPSCGCVIRLRPEGYFKGHQSSTVAIRTSLSMRLKTGRWPPGCVPNRARHWLRALKRHAVAIFGFPALADLMGVFDRLISMGRVPVSRTV